jgi:hypothetical protein
VKFANLSKRAIERIRKYRYDRILEKHEGPWDWSDFLEYSPPEFMVAGEHTVLLPVDRKNHWNIKILRVIPSCDGNVLTLFLKDTTYEPDPEDHIFSGRMSVCEKVEGEEFFIATVYHESFIIKNPG